MPNNTGMAFVVVQHLSPNFKSMMDELMAKHTKMPICLAEDGIELEPDTIYLNPKEKNIICKNRKIVHIDKDPEHPLNLPIDVFFHSLGNDLENKSVGIVLSGTGTDGSRGISTIKGAGGIVIVQEPDTAQFDGMPVSAINSNFAEFVLPPESIGDVLIRIVSKKPLEITEEEIMEKRRDSIYFKILSTLHKRSGIDFKLYKNATLMRRIEKRMAINQGDSIEKYYAFLNTNEKEQEILVKDLLIGVTGFFRDREAFQSLKEKVFPQLFKNTTSRDTLRFWVPACSTGEEAYSIAMLVDEYLEENQMHTNYKIFATDVDRESIHIASVGRYPVNYVTDIPSHILEKQFIKKGNFFEVNKKLREKIIFSTHNILKDPPFIRMDFISCRNFLIYMLPRTQAKITNIFQFGLNKGGYLFLGHSENLGTADDLFKAVDPAWRIYQSISDKKELPSRIQTDYRQRYTIEKYDRPVELHRELEYKDSPESFFLKKMIDAFAPSCIFIDKNFRILYVNGDVNDYVKIIPGVSNNNLLDMLVDKNLSAMIRNGVRRVFEEQKKIIFNDIVFQTKSKQYSVNIGFQQYVAPDSNTENIMISFEKNLVSTDDAIVYDQYKLDEFSKQRIDNLETELKQSRHELQKTVEELETSNEELQASNEELQASNEELQSTNEELQSVNEELYTVNAEVQGKNRELLELNNDMDNILDSTKIGILFLDEDLRIRKFTPALKVHFNLNEEDIGRPISNFAANFPEKVRKDFISDSKKALKSKKVLEKQFLDDFGNYFLRKTSPFSTNENETKGVVISLVNITRLKKNELALKESEAKHKKLFGELERIIENFPGLVFYKDLNNKFIRVNKNFADLHHMTSSEMEGKSCYELYPEHLARGYHEADMEVFKTDKPKLHIIEPLQVYEGCFWVSVSKIPLKDVNGKTIGIIAIAVDITELKNKVTELEQSERRLKQTQEIAHIGSWEMDLETGRNNFSDEFYRICGYEPEQVEFTSKKVEELIHPDDREKSRETVKHAIKNHTEYELEQRIERPDGNIRHILSKGKILFDDNKKARKFIRSFLDITDRKNAEISLKKSEEKFRNLFDTMIQGVVYQNHEGAILSLNPAAEEILGLSLHQLQGITLLDPMWKIIKEDGGEFSGDQLPAMISLKTGKEVKNVIMGIFNAKYNTYKWINVSTKPLFEPGNPKPAQVYATLEDITERFLAEQKLKRQTNQLIQSEKINAIGTLIAGVAHELNNPIMGIMNYANYIKKNVSDSKKVMPVLSDLLEEAEKSADIVKNLLTFSRKSDQKDNKVYSTDILKVIQNGLKIIKLKTKNNDIEFSLPNPESSTFCNINEGYAQQVFFNILDNAVAAVKTSKIKKINIDIETDQPDEYIVVNVSDTGLGIDEETLQRIFDPFYTTKEVGEGTGLGLSICKNIMEEIGGKISCTSVINEGTVFHLSFPVTSKKNQPENNTQLTVD
jgi:two-component system CheB/CheR fusion protein